MVADGHPFVVGQQRVVGAEQLADGGGVVDAHIEVGVVADLAGNAHAHCCLGKQRFFPRRLHGAALAQALAQLEPQGAPLGGWQVHHGGHVVGGDQPGLAQRQHLVTNGHAHLPGGAFSESETAKRQVLDGEVGVLCVGRGHPAQERRVVGFVDHALNSRSCRKAPCLGARLVTAHSLSMSHLTASRRWIMASSSGSGQASSTRWPLGSKK